MLHLSIFSFDTVKVRWGIPRCIAAAAVVVILAEFFVARTDAIWREMGGGGIGVFLGLEDSVVTRHGKPRLLIFGSSRARGHFLPTVIEEQMGFESGQVMSLALGGGNPFDALQLYRRGRETLRHAQIVVVGLDSWQLSFNRWGFSDRQQFLMGWKDRLAYTRPGRGRLLRGFFFKLPDTSPYLKAAMARTARREPLQRPGVDQYGRLAVVRIANDHDEENFTEDAFRFWVNEFHMTFEYSTWLESQLVELLSLVAEDGAKVYVVQMPMAGNYLDLLKEFRGNPYGEFRERILCAVGHLASRVMFWEDPAVAGLTDQDYRDWGHLNTRGAHKWSEFFVDWLSGVGAVEEGGSGDSPTCERQEP